jgi:hypothetical protein
MKLEWKIDNLFNTLNEVRMDALLRETPSKTHARSNDITDIKVLYDNVYQKGRLMRFEVKGTTGNIYHPSIYFAEKYNPDSNVRCRCSCPAFKWWGSGYNARNEGYRLRQTSGEQIKPNIRDPNNENKLCKHLIAVMEEVPKLAEHWKQEEFNFIKQLPKPQKKGYQKKFPFMKKKKDKQLEFPFDEINRKNK